MLTVDETGDRVDPRHLERGRGLERRQDAGQPAREHRLPRSGRAAEEEVVAAGGRELERAPSLVPGRARRRGRAPDAAPFAVGHDAAARAPARARRAGTRPPRRDGAPARPRRRRAPPRGPSRPGRGGARPRAGARPPRPRARRRRARSRPSSASSPTAAVRSSALRGSCWDAASTRERDRQVEAGALLAQLGRREVDGDAALAGSSARRRRSRCGRARAPPGTRGRRGRRSRSRGRRPGRAPRRRRAAARGRRAHG